MKPAHIKKWISTLRKTTPSPEETSSSSTISSPQLPGGEYQLHEELLNLSSKRRQRSGSPSHHHRHRHPYQDSDMFHRLHTRSVKAKNPRVQVQGHQVEDLGASHDGLLLGSTPLGSHIASESTRQTMTDLAIPPQLNLRLHDYEFCDLLWLRPNLEGHEVTGARHPFHHTHYDSSGATTRSLVVFIATVCLPEQHHYSKPAGFGLFFNKFSELNISDSFDMTLQLESSYSGARGLLPHLVAAKNALEAVRTEIVPDRIQLIRDVALRYGWTEEDVQDVARFHLVVGTDSQALLDEISSWKSSNQLRRSLEVDPSGEKDSLVELLDQIEALSRLGIQVMWSPVSERWNRPAQKLAADAVIRYCSRMDGKKPLRVTGSGQPRKPRTGVSDCGDPYNPFAKRVRTLPNYGYLGSFWGYRGL